MKPRPVLSRIGKYPVVRKLGEGATSEVYLCSDPFNAREVAVKVALAEALADPQRGRLNKKLFLNEASLAGKLQHPHICEIYDAAADDNLHYIVMEYAPGGTLQQFCRPDTLLPLERAIEMVFKCSRALEYAHKLGIIHRDLKPANILFAGGTDVKVSDFGTALIASGGDTTQVTAVGSPAYMSPEQLREQALDFRTDVYSMGVVLYHLLTGRLPFQAPNDFGLVYQIVNVDPAPVSAYRPEIPPELDAIVRQAMHKERDKRYDSWAQFSLDLAEAFRGQRKGARQAYEFADADRFEALRRLPFFSEFTDAELWEVARVSAWRRAAPGETLMKEGEAGDFFCILAQGQVKVTRKGKLLNLLHAGEPFGEMAYLARRGHTRGADVAVATEADIISVPTEKLAAASEACRHKFDRAFMQILLDRLSMANLRLTEV